MHLLVGLGNPGTKYAQSRHNVGFMAVTALANRHGLGPWRKRFQSDVADGAIAGNKVLLLKPQTFMNESGRAVGEALRFFKLSPAAVTVFYDELDLAPGQVRVKTGGGAAGHNGIRSLTDHIGAEFQRVRIGIGHPGHKGKVTGWVLGDFAAADHDWLDPLLDRMAEQTPLLLDGRPDSFMSKIAQPEPAGAPPPSPADTPPPPPPPAKTNATDSTSPFAKLKALLRPQEKG